MRRWDRPIRRVNQLCGLPAQMTQSVCRRFLALVGAVIVYFAEEGPALRQGLDDVITGRQVFRNGELNEAQRVSAAVEWAA